jgi:hypothetical protein
LTECPEGISVGELPEAERIWRVVRGQADPNEVAALADIAAANPDLAHEWQIARELRGSGSASVTVVKLRSYLAPFLAAAAVLMVVFVPLLWRQAPGHDQVYRGVDEETLQNELVAGEALSRNNFVLRWTEVGNDAVYTVTVMTPDLQVVAKRRDLVRPEIRIPASDLGQANQFVWRVDAAFPDGRSVASETFVVFVQ